MPSGTDLKQEVAGLYSYADPLHRLMHKYEIEQNRLPFRPYPVIIHNKITIQNEIIIATFTQATSK